MQDIKQASVARMKRSGIWGKNGSKTRIVMVPTPERGNDQNLLAERKAAVIDGRCTFSD
jgi:hypothetical protein